MEKNIFKLSLKNWNLSSVVMVYYMPIIPEMRGHKDRKPTSSLSTRQILGYPMLPGSKVNVPKNSSTAKTCPECV